MLFRSKAPDNRKLAFFIEELYKVYRAREVVSQPNLNLVVKDLQNIFLMNPQTHQYEFHLQMSNTPVHILANFYLNFFWKYVYMLSTT